jgi:predicted nucleic acid-binding protein
VQFAELYCPGYVLVEALHLRKSVWKNRELEFHKFAQDFVASNVIKSPVTVKQLFTDTNLKRVARVHGIADASVLYVASRASADVLTDDKRLYASVPTDPSFRIFLFRDLITGGYENA